MRFASFSFARLAGWMIPYLLVHGLNAQHLVEGKSTAASGMLFHDPHSAEDNTEKEFHYTICPDAAGCLSLDFVEHAHGGDSGYFQIFTPVGAGWREFAIIGGEGNRHLETEDSCVKVIFYKHGKAKSAHWNMLWRSNSTANCLTAGKNGHGLQNLCAPYGVADLGAISDHPGRLPVGWVQRRDAAAICRFVATKSGLLEFVLRPENLHDDLNWVLWRAQVDSAGNIPLPRGFGEPIAWNLSEGRHIQSATGMLQTSPQTSEWLVGSPFCTAVPVKAGDQFLLLVENADGSSKRFDFQAGSVVMACPGADATQPSWTERKMPIPSRCEGISSSVQVLRLDLNTKMNLILSNFEWSQSAVTATSSKGSGRAAIGRGIGPLLLYGMATGQFQAYEPSKGGRQVQYGELLSFAQGFTKDKSTVFSPLAAWMEFNDPQLSDFCHYLELVVEQCTDRVTSVQTRRIRQIRLIWADGMEITPDFCVAVLNYDGLLPAFQRIRISLPQNDAAEMSLHDLMSLQLFESIPVQTGGKALRSLGGLQAEQQVQLQLQDFLWSK